MKKLLIALMAPLILTPTLLNAAENETPDYVKSAQDDIETALISNVFNRPDFKCHSLQAVDQTWTLGCFLPVKNPSPFLLFSVTPDIEKTNPPLAYKVHALNGKAKQYAQNEALQIFKIDDTYSSSIDIGEMRNKYINLYSDK